MVEVVDLFTPRNTYADQGLLKVKKVLLVGEAGAGKRTAIH